MQRQIQETIREHLEKELAIQIKLPDGQRMKVLSLFFIDRVANYANENGKIRKWFIEAYSTITQEPRYKELNPLPIDKVHNGYFAQDKGKAKDTSGNTKADDETYRLIMKDKEELLSMGNPLKFIFSHSALREGWDNPNVFQICTLNETKSEIKKRQEIGRGLRLPVIQTGERCFDTTRNRLTVIANENYEDFAKKLQTEIEEDCGVSFQGRISNKRERKQVRLRQGWRLSEDFKELWERIKHKTRYSVSLDKNDLIKRASKAIFDLPPIEKPQLRAIKTGLEMDKSGVSTRVLSVQSTAIHTEVETIPDIIGYLQRETELTRKTLLNIVLDSGRISDILVNPQEFLDQSLIQIKRVMQQMMVDGIKYERIADAEYEMLLFEEHEIISYIERLEPAKNSIYEEIEVDSETERRFVQALSDREDIKLFLKLPGWFKIETPLGNYNPDWAIVKQSHDEPEKLYLVRETKGTLELLDMRPSEKSKIQCGKAHFDELGVDFKHIQYASQV